MSSPLINPENSRNRVVTALSVTTLLRQPLLLSPNPQSSTVTSLILPVMKSSGWTAYKVQPQIDCLQKMKFQYLP
jgi:hypothetical protein